MFPTAESVLRVSEIIRNNKAQKERATHTLADCNTPESALQETSGIKVWNIIARCRDTVQNLKNG